MKVMKYFLVLSGWSICWICFDEEVRILMMIVLHLIKLFSTKTFMKESFFCRTTPLLSFLIFLEVLLISFLWTKPNEITFKLEVFLNIGSCECGASLFYVCLWNHHKSKKNDTHIAQLGWLEACVAIELHIWANLRKYHKKVGVPS